MWGGREEKKVESEKMGRDDGGSEPSAASGRRSGEIAEAPPVAEEARRFRGSAPIGGHDSGRESVGTTVGKRAPPLRTAKKSLHQADRAVRPYKLT